MRPTSLPTWGPAARPTVQRRNHRALPPLLQPGDADGHAHSPRSPGIRPFLPDRGERLGRFGRPRPRGEPAGGCGPGLAGTDYVALSVAARPSSTTIGGQPRHPQVKGGGYLDEIRNASGEGLILPPPGGIPHKTVLSGTVARPKRQGTGTTTLQTVEGLGQFGDIRVTLTSPPFIVRQYPFFLRSGRPLAVRSLVSPPAK